MIAYRLLHPQEPPQLQEVPKPSPSAGQLLIKVGGCGLCHTDIAIMSKTKAQLDEWHATPPFTLGHEIAGWVAEIGQGVVGFKAGEPIAVVPVWGSCGHCPPCRRGVGGEARIRKRCSEGRIKIAHGNGEARIHKNVFRKTTVESDAGSIESRNVVAEVLWIVKQQVSALAFYSAYPEASVREVWKALKTKKAFDVLLDAAS